MRRPYRSLLLATAALLSLAGACDEQTDGDGYLVYSDRGNPPVPGHFTAEPSPYELRLGLRPNGCVTVFTGDVERVPLWPDGTKVTQVSTDPVRYEVVIREGLTLEVTETSGDRFTALGIVDDGSGPLLGPDQVPTKAESLLGFCGVPAAPIAFPGADYFPLHGGD